MTLTEGIRFFTRETEILDGLSVACGAGARTETAMDGNVREESVFDLASVTKLFTGLCALKLKEEGLLDFSRPVFSYDSRFRGLKGISVGQLMAFEATVRTPARIDACADRERAAETLFAAESLPERERRPYSDIPAMILKYVMEAAGGAPLAELVRQTVLEPAGMKETWAAVPRERIGDCLSYDREHRIEQGRRILRDGLKPGIPHDPKAALLQGDTGDLCGHAGLFSTRGDMIRFCRAVLERRVVGEESLREMAVNRTGRKMPEGGHSQYLGMQCFVRHPEQYYSEIPAYMGRGAFGIYRKSCFRGSGAGPVYDLSGEPGAEPADGADSGAGENADRLRTERGRFRTLPLGGGGNHSLFRKVCAPEGRPPPPGCGGYAGPGGGALRTGR